VKIRQKGQRLYLRATVPNRNGEGQKQTDIATGCPATEQGLKLALAKAQALEADILLERFTWEQWGTNQPQKDNIENAVLSFEQAYWRSRERTPARADQFQRDYLDFLKHLPPDEPLSQEVLTRVLLRFEPQTRARKFAHQSFTRLAKFHNIELPPTWAELKGSYKPSNQRTIPTDQEIIETWERLQGRWKWAYGVIASYGIRNHEIAHISLEQYPILTVGDKTKTGARIVYPLHKDWPDRFGLQIENRPNITVQINRDIGSQVGHAFRHNKVGHSPYALRDAYAIRGTVLGISPVVMSKWLGHSLDTHYSHYLRWIEQRDFDDVWQGLK
jgi:hypothetical protein